MNGIASRLGSAGLVALNLCATAVADTPSAGARFDACIDYHCDMRQTVALDDRTWRGIVAPLRSDGDAAAERTAIAESIARMEREVGRQTGTWRDRPRNDADNGEPGQLDCIAESTNTTTYLRMLEHAGLLRWHVVEERLKRQRWVFAVHWTAVIRDTHSGERFAVDAWYGGNGTPPFVQPLQDWRAGIEPPATPDT
ncbi:MAG: hypothetical protein KDJ33_07860 [Gammaproteobacteria bacterium]|nr:hypothetical protein [Gammaproteobacteria bacterium]